MASEAIHDYRARSRSQPGPLPSPNPQAAIATSSRSDPVPEPDAPPAYVEVADEATAEMLVRDGKAEYVVGSADDGKRSVLKASEAEYDVEDNYSSDEGSEGVDLDEEAWELDEMAERVAPPSYADQAPEDMSEEASIKKEEQMIRDIVRLAGPPPQPARRIPCPVIIPQRRPRNKDRGFVRAYAPVLEDCGVSPDAFLKFQQDWLVASKVSVFTPWRSSPIPLTNFPHPV